MPTRPLLDELAKEAADAFLALGEKAAAATLLHLLRTTFQSRLKVAAERGMVGTKPVLPGFRIAQISNTPNGDFIKQRREHGAEFEVPAGHVVKGVSALVDEEGREVLKWVKTGADGQLQAEAFEAMVAALKEDLPRVSIMPPPAHVEIDLLNQFVVTDNHFGVLAWAEETGASYDLKIAEKLLLDWFAAAIASAPQAHTPVLAQLGDLSTMARWRA